MKKHNRWEIETINVSGSKSEVQSDARTPRLIAWIKKNRKKLIIISVVAYVLFFLFGFFTTRYYTDENGVRRAYRLSMEDLKKQEDYEALKQQLTKVRELLTEITVVDIHIANEELSAYEAATGYTTILNEELDVMIPKISALNIQDKQKPIQEAIASLLSNDLALYLQKISEALKTGNTGTVSTALAYREKAMSTYEIIEKALREISDELCMGDGKYYDWTLADAVTQKDPTAILRQTEGS